MLTVAIKPIIISVFKLSAAVLGVVRLSVVRLNAVVPMLWHQRNEEENLKINSPKIVFFDCSVAEATCFVFKVPSSYPGLIRIH